MSSPLSSFSQKSLIKAISRYAHKNISHNHRISLLSLKICELLRVNCKSLVGDCDTSIIDIGCGDMGLSSTIKGSLGIPRLLGVDIHPLNQSFKVPEGAVYSEFDGKDLSTANLNNINYSKNISFFIDVLHHVNYSDVDRLVRSASINSRFILIKDHVEKNIFDRLRLQFLDILGNWGYGISIPRSYFRETFYTDICKKHNLILVYSEKGPDLYCHIPLVGRLFPPHLQIVALYKVMDDYLN